MEAAMSLQDPARMYSWWWDSHICPKNSKWLQENLTDMDDKIKLMIELIEEDADSFARRAEMYYKRRPELMKLVEEFYRAYRALAERYDHANGMIRQAHQTMVKAFPDQVPAMLTDATDTDAHFRTSEKSGDLGDYLSCFCVVEGLCEANQSEKIEDSTDSPQFNASVLPKLVRGDSSDASILLLKKALEKLEAENEVRLVQQQHNLERLSNIESEILRAQNDSRGLNERGSKAEAEVQELKEALSKLETEKEATLAQYQQCLERISNLEKGLFNVQGNASEVGEEKDRQAELEVEIVKQELGMVLTEKKLFLEKISDLEVKIVEAENQVRRINERADKAEGKVENLKQELMEKQKELRRLWSCIQEEQSRFVEAETAFQNLQHLHFQSKEKLTCLYVELENKTQTLKDLEVHNLGLKDEILKVRKENESLHKLNLSSEKSMENMKIEISGLRTEVATLQQEDELRTQQKNGLHREICRLKEELGDLNKKHGSLLEQIESLGMNPELLSSSVKLLQDENVKLIGVLQSEKHEKLILLEKLEAMEKHISKIAALESFVSDLNVELDGAREKVKALEESCQVLLREMSTLISEKAGLISQLHSVTENSHKLGEKNAVLQNTINDATVEIEGLREKLKQLECSNQLLDNEKSSLNMERGSLYSRLETTQQGFKNLQMRYEALEGETSHLEKLRMAICKMSRELDIDVSGSNDWTGHFSQILSKVKNMCSSLDFALEQNQELVLENSVLTTLLSQLRLEAADLETEKNALCQNLWINTQQLETLGNEVKNLKQFYEEMGKDDCGKYEKVGNQVESSYVKPKHRTKTRSSALHKRRNEAEMWENEAAEIFSKLQISAVQGALIIEKVQDFQSPEKTTGTRDAQIQLMKQRVDILEYENKGLKAQLSEYIPAILTLRKCVESLESHFIVNEVFTKTNNEEAKGAESRIPQPIDIHRNGKNDIIAKSLDGLSELQDLQHRVAVIEQVVEEIEKLSDHETVERGQHVYVDQDEEWKKDPRKNSHIFPSQFSHGGTEMPKDIMLDQISGALSNGIVRRGTREADDNMLELWETVSKTGSIDLAVDNLQKLDRRKKKNLSSETAVQKAMDVIDKLEISKRDVRPRKECKKRRIQDRLDSDALKLINLQITVQDLRKKVETTMESKKGKGLEYSSLKEQLKEAEKVIIRLFDTNGKLKKKIDDGYSSSEEQYGVKLDKTESFKRRGVTDRARRASEKIKRLQLEVQRLQFLLLNLEEGKDTNGKTKITESKSRVLLRDYLYGGVRTIHDPQSKKMPHCCACVQPPTKGD